VVIIEFVMQALSEEFVLLERFGVRKLFCDICMETKAGIN
jgi:hypothetical protein